MVLWTVPACGDPGSAPYGDGRWHGETLRREGGVVVVRNPEVGVWTRAERWRLEEDLRIGSYDEEPYVFDRVRGLRTDAAGRIYLGMNRGVLKVFEPDGSFLRTVGEYGEGPGEMISAFDFDVFPDGSVWVVDSPRARYSLFDSSGAFVRTVPRRFGIPTEEGAVAVGPDGRAWDGWSGPYGPYDPPELRTVGVDTATGEAVGPVLEVPGAVPWVWDAISDERPFIHSPTTWVARDRRGHVWWGRGDEYRLVELDPAGDTVRVVERAATPRAISSDTSAVLAEYREQLRRIGYGVREGLRIPATLPFFGTFVRDDAGNLWVAVYETPARTRRFDVFDPEGRYLGRIDAGMELRSWPLLVREEHLYAVTVDRYDVPYVVRFRIEKPPT